jgi:acyl-CoA thioester hydrolase
MPHKIYTQKIKVIPAHIDDRKHVNNLVYLQWCLDAAEKHWRQNASEKMRAQYVWYVMSHQIDYNAAAFLGEELEVTTWVEYTRAARSERHYKIVRPSDNRTLVKAKSIWCLLDTKILKPVKITEEIHDLFL